MITNEDLKETLALLERDADEPKPSATPTAPAAPDSIGTPQLISQCSWCHRYQLGGQWVRIDDPPHAQFTHGICPPCAAEQRADLRALSPDLPVAPPPGPDSIGKALASLLLQHSRCLIPSPSGFHRDQAHP